MSIRDWFVRDHTLTSTSAARGSKKLSFRPSFETLEDRRMLAAGILQFSATGYSVKENVATVTISVTRTSGRTGAVSVHYATSDGTATAGLDYVANSGTLNWARGETRTKTFAISIIDDSLVEGNETVNLKLDTPTGGARLGARKSAVLTIIDNDTAANTFYVATTGSDANDGSSAHPWRTLQFAANTVHAGDTVIVHAGNYIGFDMVNSGTSAAPITFQADAGVVINQANMITPDGINLEGASWIVIQGFTVTGMPRAGIRSVTNQHVTIRGNTTDKNGEWGIFSGFSDDLTIENNVASNSVQQHGIYVSNSGDRPIIRGNTIFGNHDAGIHMNGDISQGGDGIITGALVEDNIIYDNGLGGASGINCDGVQQSRIQNNLLYNNHASGISLYQIDGGGPSSNNVVVNNTVIVASDGRWALNIQNGSTGNTVYNNIFYNFHSFRGAMDISQDSLTGFVSDYNVVISRFTLDGGNSVLSLAQWQATTGQDTHSIVATPDQLFVNPAGNDYHLKAGSPAIDAGTATQAPLVDLEGHARPHGNGFDIGCYEF